VSKLKVKKVKENAILPKQAHPGDAGYDLYACEEKTIEPGGRALVDTGIAIQLPKNHEAQVRPRSGLALKRGITILNTPGTIDEGYRNAIGVILMNHSDIHAFKVQPGDRIAQMVINKVEHLEIEEVEELDDSSRGQGGFGSTGK
jgi:dUTP pyrophosphatase